MRAGAQISHFEILSMLGRGGMGEVWRARDTRLRRDVAIKTLPPEFATDADRVARLEREATLLASLNHPHIAAIYGFEETELGRFMVLELVDGETLADRLRSGPMPIDEALDVAVQIAEALEAAHEKGVIHRDLKPANIKLGLDGAVKVLDFGLAKDVIGHAGEPTLTALHTMHGVVMGTPAYMSPEQARGETTTRQTDIWSFGVILFEMLTGTSPFQADTTAETLANVLRAAPNYSLLPAGVSPRVLRVLRRCLQNARRERLQAIGDARLEIEDARDADAQEGPRRPSARLRWPLGAVVALSLVALGVLAAHLTGHATSSASATVHLSIPRLDAPAFQPYGLRHVAISEDGSTIAYAALSGMWVRRLGEEAAVQIKEPALDPFFSPDGHWVGFFNGGVRKVSSGGGTSQLLVPNITARPTGAVWMPDGTIVFATAVGLYRVSDSGGAPELLASPDRTHDERVFAWPAILDRDTLLITVITGGAARSAHIATFDLRTRALRYVLTGGGSARYLPSGHMIFAANGALNAVAFDSRARATRGAPIALPGTQIGTTDDFASAEFAVSPTGTLVSLPPRPPTDSTVVWVDRQGHEEKVELPLGPYGYPRVSPDGTRIALGWQSADRDIWVWDLGRRTLARVTDDPAEDTLPLWSLDGRRIFFTSNREGEFHIYSTAADGASAPRLEFAGPKFDAPNSFTPDGTQLVTFEDFSNLDVVDLASGTARPLLHGDVVQSLGALSPDGRWIAYESWDPTRTRADIYVRPFPDVMSRREKISIAGGRYPVWARNGSAELYYVDLDGYVTAAAVATSPELRLGAVTRLFAWEKPPPNISGLFYDVSPTDGRFLMVKPTARPADASVDLSVTLNWLAEVERLAAAH
jgi:protein kinase-like protein/WD40 repeat protein